MNEQKKTIHFFLCREPCLASWRPPCVPANVNTFLNTVCLTVVGVEGAKEEEEDDLGHVSEKRNRGFFFQHYLS